MAPDDRHSAFIRVFSNVPFPPYDFPQEVARGLADWPLPHWMSWDVASNQRSSAAFLLGSIALRDWGTDLFLEMLEKMAPQVMKLDRILVGLGRSMIERPEHPIAALPNIATRMFESAKECLRLTRRN